MVSSVSEGGKLLEERARGDMSNLSSIVDRACGERAPTGSAAERNAEQRAGALASLRGTIQHRSETRVRQRQSHVSANKP